MSRLSSLIPHIEMENLGFGDFGSRPPLTNDIDSQIVETKQVFSDVGIEGQKIESLNVSKLRAGSLNIDTYIQSTGFVSGTTGWKIEGDGDAEFASITLSGGTIKYGKTSFTDSTNAGYWIGSSGVYFGAASDTTKLKYNISTGLFDFIGTVSSRSTATLAASINVQGNLITDILNDALDSNAQDILSAFEFGAGVYDSFSGAAVDGTKWTVFEPTYVTVSGGTLNIATTTGILYAGIYSIANFDMTNSWFRVKVTDAGNQALATYEVNPVMFQLDASNRIWFTITGGYVSAYKTIATVQTQVGSSVAYDSDTMVYFQMRESAGTMYLEYSADLLTWTSFASVANPWPVTSLRYYIQAGTWGAEATTTVAKLDDASMPTFDGGFRSGDITWSTLTGAVTGGSGIALNRNGIVGAAAGVATFTIDAKTGSATFAGTLSAATGTLGSITLASGGNIKLGQTAYDTGSGFWLGDVGGTTKLSIGDGTVANSLTWDGTTLLVNGSSIGSTGIWFGDGSDGDVTISVDTTITRDMFYNNLTVNSGKVLNTGGFRIFVKGTATINGKVARNGNAGGDGEDTKSGSGSAGGTAGAALSGGTLPAGTAGQAGGTGVAGAGTGGAGVNGTSKTLTLDDSNGSAGGAGANGVSAAGGTGYAGGAASTGGTATPTTVMPHTYNQAYLLSEYVTAVWTLQNGGPGSGSAGAGGGWANGIINLSGGGGGGSGSTGGVVFFAAARITGSGTIEAKGGDGGHGGNVLSGFYCGGGGGGGGGNGGIILLAYQSLTGVTTSVAGGALGAGGTIVNVGNPGNPGVAGSDGTVFTFSAA